MERTITLVWTRRDWIAGPVSDNFREEEFTGTREAMVAVLKAGEDDVWEKLDARDGNRWLTLFPPIPLVSL